MMLIYLILVIGLGWMYLRLPTSFLPEEDQGYLVANIELPAGATANRTQEIIKKVETYFGNIPAVKNMITVLGYSFNGNGLNAAIAFVTRSEEQTSELQSLIRISYAAFCLIQKNNK